MSLLETSSDGEINLGHLLAAAGILPGEVVAIRHTFKDYGLVTPADLNDEKVLAYTRSQEIGNKLGAHPPRVWLSFIAESGLRARFLVAHDNHGEIRADRTDTHRFFDLAVSPLLSKLRNRLSIEWSRDAVNWAKRGESAQTFRVVEIADPQNVPFPGFDRLIVDHHTLGLIIEDSRFRDWRSALASVQGIYLITDTKAGKHYVGKADGRERILGRWRSYWKSGHGGNLALRDLTAKDASSTRHFQFSLLRVFGPDVPLEQVDSAEAHFKKALCSREFGYNQN